MLTTTGFAREFQCTNETVRRWIRLGTIQAIRLPQTGTRPSRYRIPVEEVQRLRAQLNKEAGK